MSLYSLARRVELLLEEAQKQTLPAQLPFLCLDDEGGDLPGCEARNRYNRGLAAQLHIQPKIYHFDPEDEGTED